ncbi:MAG: hypothetical protein ABIH39_02095 [Candidatus Margulisiibacteriota bacterium]
MNIIKILGVFVLAALLPVTAASMIITDDGRVVFTKESPAKIYTFINDTAEPVSLNISLMDQPGGATTMSCQQWINLPNEQVLVPAYTIEKYNIGVNAPKTVSQNTFWSGQLNFSYSDQQQIKPVIVFHGTPEYWITSGNILYEEWLSGNAAILTYPD